MQLATPHAVVDTARVQANIAKVAEYARGCGIKVRPHVKTHKDLKVASLQLEAGATGVTVATAREAEVMAEVTDDILVAYPPVDPHRISRLLALPRSVELKVSLDSVQAVQRLAERLVYWPRRVEVLVEIDLGGRRTGVGSALEMLEIIRACQASEHLHFLGLMVHPGNLRPSVHDPGNPKTWSDASPGTLDSSIVALSAELARYLDFLKDHQIEYSIVSGGNTPSLFASHLISGLTEIRPGTYVYCDRDIASQGIFGWEDCAYSILSTVVSTAVPGQAVIDAGTKAIAREPLAGLDGFGALLDRPEVIVKSMSEEHGILDLSRTSWRPQIGDRVRVVPNHVCVSVHLQDQIAFMLAGNLEVRSVPARAR
jgi:D-serine deaminase-like pyridoxal phosphate-dependent protein